MTDAIGVSLLGAGNVGAGVVRALTVGSERYSAAVGRPLELRHALVRDASRPREGLAPHQITTDLDVVLGDDQTSIVVELMGGEEPARSYIAEALGSGRHVVTANKEVIAKHGSALRDLASEGGVRLLYEASVGGGIPIISPLFRDLLANEITAVTAIINGTTNYMLTAMTQDGDDYADALAEAQRLGYAEPDPTADVEGHDAAFKLAILCALAFHVEVRPEDVVQRGITQVTARDIRYASTLGYAIKLLAEGRLVDGEIIASVQPTLIGREEPLSKVDGVLNAVQVEGDLVGRVVLEGPGAGAAPTSSAVLADVLDIARDIVAERRPPPPQTYRSMRVRSPGEHRARRYVRMTVADRPGVLGEIGTALGARGVSIASVVQFEVDEDARTAEIVLTTHAGPGEALEAALADIAAAEVVVEVGNVLAMAG
ncbi:MAG: homoserine dehydrogenase [Chloroflexi bacterium]|nr:homoserine dehydrogenase [Chloroflexota bacterium]